MLRLMWISAVKDLRRQLRDPFVMILWIGVPLVMGLLIHLVFGGEGSAPQGRLLIADQDNSIVSNLLTAAFNRPPLGKMLDAPHAPVFATAAVNVRDCPATTARTSGSDEYRVMATPSSPPNANSVPPFNVYTIPSGPITVGT